MITTDVITGLVGSLWGRWQEYQKLRGNEEALQHLLMLECRRNLALIGAVRLDADTPNDTPAYRLIAAEFESAVLEQLFLPEKASRNTLDVLRGLSLGKNAEEPDARELAASNLAMSVYVRMTALQKLARLPTETEGLRAIRYRQRLEHLRDDLLSIVQALELHIAARS